MTGSNGKKNSDKKGGGKGNKPFQPASATTSSQPVADDSGKKTTTPTLASDLAASEAKKRSSPAGSLNDEKTFAFVIWGLVTVLCLQALFTIGREAYEIRMYAIREYGRVIHEFDPYFNYRATEYLYANGWNRFKNWFDYMVWYPLGRPVGTTIYPGMQVTSVWIKNHILPDWSINDICCFVPAWFGVAATMGVALLTYECTGGKNYKCYLNTIVGVSQVYQHLIKPALEFVLNLVQSSLGTTMGLRLNSPSPKNKVSFLPLDWTPLLCAVCSAAVMSILPAHLLRSVGGGYDNESIAMTAMVMTFACWVRALRDDVSELTTIIWGLATGVAYFYMVAAWGGFTFVLNLVGIHASYLVMTGRYSTKLHRAYTCFYVLGTALATTVPVVGWTPLKSLEQLGPFVAAAGMQLIEICEVIKRRSKRPLSVMDMWKLRIQVFGVAAIVGLAVIVLLLPTGYFGPLSSRVRGLFVKHTKTGNPLVDSVAEHQAANSQAFFQYLNQVLYIAPVGLAITMAGFVNDSSSFLVVYTAAAYYFSTRMVRLILLTAPIASALAGIAFGRILAWGLNGLIGEAVHLASEVAGSATSGSEDSTGGKKKKKGKKASTAAPSSGSTSTPKTEPVMSRGIRVLVVGYLIYEGMPKCYDFYDMAHELATHLSHPTIIQKARTRDGTEVLVDDYRQSYFWLRDNTPEDARIMAWWDYGYQITGISNRTSLADGNTWNMEHISLLGRTLTAPEREAHRIARHLADYVLVWAGGGGDDLAKSPHLRRIANSVYRGLCSEPTCRDFGFYADRAPTPSMEASLLYKLVLNGYKPGVEPDKNRFREVYRSKYGKVRIYKIMSVSQDSKEWIEKNRVCDVPGSWYCPGQYPPALNKVLAEKKDFQQLEDFNIKGDDSDYQKEYFENLNKKSSSVKRKKSETSAAGSKQRATPPSEGKLSSSDLSNFKNDLDSEDIDIINEHWENTQLTTLMWNLISSNDFDEFYGLIQENPSLVHIRSEDGRGPIWWAHEYGRTRMVQIMKKLGVREDRTDEKGLTPLDVSKIKK